MKEKARSCGFSYIEVLLAILMIAGSLVPIMETLQSTLNGVSVYESSTVDQFALQSKMEEVLKCSFVALDTAATTAGGPTVPTSYSDSVPFTTTDGRQITRQVYLWPYDIDNGDGDGDPFTGTDSGVLYMKVEIDGSPFFFETLTSE